MNKKGSELSMNLIIIAAIAVLILVILTVFVLRSSGNLDKSTGCSAMNGKCYPDTIHKIRYIPGDKECAPGKCYIALASSENP